MLHAGSITTGVSVKEALLSLAKRYFASHEIPTKSFNFNPSRIKFYLAKVIADPYMVQTYNTELICFILILFFSIYMSNSLRLNKCVLSSTCI